MQSKGIILTRSRNAQTIVHRICPAARSRGVREGLSLELARALSPFSFFGISDSARDYERLHSLALWCTRFTPLVGLDRELTGGFNRQELDTVASFHYGITLDLTGTERLHGPLDRFAQNLALQFFKRTIEVKLALAPTIGAAWAISRYASQKSPVILLREDEIEEQIGHLPVPALRVDDSVVRSLHDVGIVWIKDLLTLPRRTLGVRYGKQLLYRLEQSLGFIAEDLACVRSPQFFTECRKFEFALIKREAIVVAAKKLLEKLCAKLRHNNARAGMFSLLIGSKDGTTINKDFSLTLASGNEKHITSILDPLLESIPLFDEVYSLEIRALDVMALGSSQNSFVEQCQNLPDEKTTGELLNTFTMRLGRSRIRTASLHASHIPENAATYTPLVSGSLPESKARSFLSTFSSAERPSLLYTTPQPIRTIAMLPDKPPSFMQWRDISHRIVLGVGPERISSEWWKSHVNKGDFMERDYFKVQNENGQWFWIYRSRGTMEWFIHGVWA